MTKWMTPVTMNQQEMMRSCRLRRLYLPGGVTDRGVSLNRWTAQPFTFKLQECFLAHSPDKYQVPSATAAMEPANTART